MIKVGDTLPAGTLYEYNEVGTARCAVGPVAVDVQAAAAGRTVAVFGLPGAFTPACSAKHLPGFVARGRLEAHRGR